MIIKLPVLALMSVAAFALSASSASAVVLENPGMFSITGENSLALIEHHSDDPEEEEIAISCRIDAEANINAAGAMDIHNIDLSEHTGSTPNCDTMNDCDPFSPPPRTPDGGWPGQIFEHFEEQGTTNEHEFGVEVFFCLLDTGEATDGGIGFAECEINADEAHCDWFVGHVNIGVEEVDYEVEGEIFIDPALELHHE